MESQTTWSVSRITLGLEALFIALPTSIVLILLGTLDLMVAPASGGGKLFAYLLLGAAAICLCFGWRLLIRFLDAGTSALRSAPRPDWLLAHLGAILAVCGVAAWLVPWDRLLALAPDSEDYPKPIPELRGLILATPLLIPYLHLILQRCFAGDSN